MALTKKQRELLEERDLYKAFLILRASNKELGVSMKDAEADALFQMTGGDLGKKLKIKKPTLDELHESYGDDDDVREEARWVAMNMAVKDVKKEQAPSSAAYSWLLRCQTTPSTQDDFWKSTYPKLLPSQSIRDAAARFKDDGRELIALNKEIRRVLEKQSTPTTPIKSKTTKPTVASPF